MISKFAKKQNKFTANRIFTDRVDPTKVFFQSIASIPSKAQEIIVYYGKGGIGKTSLLNQLRNKSDEAYNAISEYTFHNVFLSFDSREFSGDIGGLMYLRNKLHGDGGLFDFAVVNFWAKAKFTVEEIKNKNSSLPVSLMRLLEDVVSLGNGAMAIPAFIVSEARGLVKDHELIAEFEDEMNEIAGLSITEILERLPYYLGLCFSAAARKGHLHVFFFDSYESVNSSVQGNDWLPEFLASCEILRACIASRDKLRWGLENAEWDEVLNQHLLDNLSDEDSKWFLEQVPIQDANIVEKIVFHSKGVPLFLDMSVDLYQDDMNNNRPHDFSKIRHGEKLIDRYMNYMDSNSAYAVKILSVPKFFHTEFAHYLLEQKGIRFNEEQMHRLFEKSIFVPIESDKDTWKIDESVRSHLSEQLPNEMVADILSKMLSYIKCEANGKAFPYFVSVLNTISQNPSCLIGLNEAIVEQIDFYGNSGFWLEQKRITEDFLDSENADLRAIAVMSEIIYLRRTSSLKDEEEFINSHPIDEESLGHYYFMYTYYKIQCRHLQGFYDEALSEYKKLLDEMNLIRHTIPVHIYDTICMKYADLLFLKGKFDESMSITENMLERTDLPLIDQIELMRIKGHIFRFQGHFSEARIIYTAALKLVQQKKLDAYVGKMLTNMAEANAFIAPSEALMYFEQAKQINEKNGNLIELSKAYSAAAVAYARMATEDNNNIDQCVYCALTHANQAISLAKQSGYRSGEAFALVGMALAHKHAQNQQEYEISVSKLTKLVDELNVYKYLVNLVK